MIGGFRRVIGGKDPTVILVQSHWWDLQNPGMHDRTKTPAFKWLEIWLNGVRSSRGSRVAKRSGG